MIVMIPEDHLKVVIHSKLPGLYKKKSKRFIENLSFSDHNFEFGLPHFLTDRDE